MLLSPYGISKLLRVLSLRLPSCSSLALRCPALRQRLWPRQDPYDGEAGVIAIFTGSYAKR